MKKKIFAILLVVSMIAGMLPSMVFAADPSTAGPARFLFRNTAAQEDPTLEVIINEGDAPVYLKTVGQLATRDGASSTAYNIKVTYNVGENPKVYLNGAEIKSCDNAKDYHCIVIGSATDATYNNVSVDIIVENKTSWLFGQGSWSASVINSFIDGTLTLSCQNGGYLDIPSEYGIEHGSYATIQAKGDLVLNDAKVRFYCKAQRLPFLGSTTGNVIIDGSNVELTRRSGKNYSMVSVPTAGKKIIIRNDANVTVSAAEVVDTVFSGATEIINSKLNVSLTAGTAIFSAKPTLAYTDGYTVTADGNNYDNTNFDAVLANTYNTMQSFSIVPVLPPRMEFAYAIGSGVMSNTITVNQGDAPVYLKTVLVGTHSSGAQYWAATAEGASASDYNVMFSFPAGGKPTVALKGAKFNLGDPNTTTGIVIGSATGNTDINGLAVDIVVEESSTFGHWTGYTGAAIISHITADLTINGNGKNLSFMNRSHRSYAPAGIIAATGNVKIVDANINMYNGDNDAVTGCNYITSANGSITISGGTLTATTAPSTGCSSMAILNAPNGAVVIENNANVNITAKNDGNVFTAKDGVTVKNSTMIIEAATGVVFNSTVAPVFEGYADGYKAKGDDAEYNAANYATYKKFSVEPIIPPHMKFTFADGIRTANLVKVIKVGDAPIYLKNDADGKYIVDSGNADDYDIMISFPEGGKPTLTLNGMRIRNGDGTGYGIVIGDSVADAAMNDLAVDIIVTKDSQFYHEFNWAVPNLVSYVKGDLTITSNGGRLAVDTQAHGRELNSAIYATGNVKLVNANITMSYVATADYKTDYITSANGDIVISGGTLTVSSPAGSAHSAKSVLRAPNGKITIENNAAVNFNLQNNMAGFTAANGVEIKNATVNVATASGVVFGTATAPVLTGYADGYVAKGNDAEYNAANFATYTKFSVAPYIPPHMKFTFADDARTANLVKIIKVGDAPIYLTTKAVTVGSYTAQVVTEEGASASNYSIMITFPEGGKPTLTLKGATIANGDVNGYNIIIGDSVAEAVMNDLAVDIVVAENSQLNQVFNWAVPNLLSYVKGDLTFKGDGKLTVTTYAHGSTFDSAIYATGNVKFDDIDVDIKWHGGNSGYQKTSYITSANGNITVNGGKMTIVTHSLEAAAANGKAAMKTPNGKVVIENGAEVGITVNANVAAFATKDGVVINNSSVIVAGTTGIAFSGTVAPTFEGYGAEGYIAEGDGAEYKAADFATYKTFSIRPYQVPTTRFTFVDSLETGAPTANVVVNIKEGDAPIYLKTVNKVVTADGASADDYNIKITFETGKNPTLYLKGASITSYGDAKGNNAILIGSASATEACNVVSVDIVVETNSVLEYKNGWGDSNIKSYITGTLTISSVNNAVLDLMGRMAYGNQGVIDAQGDILLKNANLNMYGYSGDDVKGYYIHSANGNITFDGGKLTAITRSLTTNCRGSILCTSAAGKNITVQNGAVLDFAINKIDTVAFNTQGDVIIKDASVAVTINAEGSKIAEKAPVIEGYANGYVAKANNAVYKPEEDAAKFAEFITFNIRPYEAPKARFVFQNFNSDPFAIEVIIEQGGAPVFLKTVGGIVTAEGASADDYQIKITFENGKSPNLYLKGAEIKTYGDAKGDHAILIGSETATDVCNDNNVNIVIQRNSTIVNEKTYGSPLIKSYITGTLTITKEKGSLSLSHMVSPLGYTAAVEVVGDLVLKNVNMKVESHHSGCDRYNYFRSSNGNIIVNAGKLTITTNSDSGETEKPTHKRIFMTAAEGKDIIFENGASVTVNVRNSAKVFGTKGNVIFDNATVKINVTGGGSIFGDTAPVIKNYAEGTVALGDDATYDAAKFAEYKTFSIEGGEPVFDEDYNDDIVDGTGSGDSDDDNGSGSGSGSGNPSTGDNTNLALLSTLVVISALGMVALVVIGKKRFTV